MRTSTSLTRAERAVVHSDPMIGTQGIAGGASSTGEGAASARRSGGAATRGCGGAAASRSGAARPRGYATARDIRAVERTGRAPSGNPQTSAATAIMSIWTSARSRPASWRPEKNPKSPITPP